MADRVSASIIIGGTVSASAFAELVEIIAAEGLAIEWDGEPFEPRHRSVGQPLSLYAHEVAGGCFDELEAWCSTQELPFVRWSGGYSGQWGPERVVHTGRTTPISYAVTDDDEVVISREVVDALGIYEAVIAHFEAADFVVPPLIVEGDPLDASLGPNAPATLPIEGGADVE
jgi:hypothetical protein